MTIKKPLKNPEGYLKILNETEALIRPLREIRRDEEGKNNICNYGKKIYGLTKEEIIKSRKGSKIPNKLLLFKKYNQKKTWFEAGYNLALRDLKRDLLKKKFKKLPK